MPGPLTWLQGKLLAGSSITKAAADFQSPAGGGVASSAAMQALYARMKLDFEGSQKDAVQFGPGTPPVPTPLDQTGVPRAYAYRVGWNIPSQPGEGRPLDLDTLEQLATTYDLMAKAITIRLDEVATMRFDVIARDTDKKRARQVIASQQATIKKIRAFFERPDRKHTWQSWLRLLGYQHLVCDGVAMHRQRTFGGELYALRILHAPTIKPLLTVHGDMPDPPDPAYQQYLYGVARDSFTTGELTYAIKNRRVNTPYGWSPVEQFITHVNTALRFQQWNSAFFTDGTMPEGVAEAPADWTAEQIAEYNQQWEAILAGDPRALRKLHFVPAGFKYNILKPYQFEEPLAHWLMLVTCAAIDVTPTELGFEPKSGLGGRGFAEEQSVVLKRKSTGPFISWLMAEIVNPVIWEEFGATDLQGSLHPEGEEIEQLQAMQARDLAIRNGTMSIDQAVEEDGGEPPGIGRILVTQQGVYFEPDLIQGTKEGVNALTPEPPAPPPGGGEPTTGERASSSGTQQAREQPATQPRTQAANKPAASVEKAADAELGRLARFARERRKAGTWRDFQSDVWAPETLAALNKAASAGASADDLRALVGLDDQPEAFKASVTEAERAYRAVTYPLAKAVAEQLERAS